MTSELRRLVARIVALVRRGKADREAARELAAHVTLLEDEYQRRGLSPDAARIAAQRALGGIDRATEIHREARSWPWVESLLRDVTFAARLLHKAPVFAVVATLTLAIGIGATTAIFTQINAIFFTTLPVDRPEELRILSWTSPRRPFAGARLTQRIWDQWISEGHHIETFSYAAYRSVADNDAGFAHVACWRRGSSTPIALGPVTLQYVSPNYFETLGADAALGRALGAADDRRGAEIAVVVSHQFWQRAFGGARSVIGRTLDLDGTHVTIVGVMPPGFFGVALAVAPEIIAPLAAAPPRNADDWTVCNIVARLREGVPEEQARARAEALVQQSLLAAPPKQPYDPPRVYLADAAHGDDDLRRVTASSLSLLMAITVLVFLVACANVASLLLARASARGRELATRLAIGASRGRIVQQLLTESGLLSTAGAAGGVALAYVLTPLLPRLLMQFIGRDALGIELTPDRRVLSFAIGLGLINGLLFGLLPAIRGSRAGRASLFRLAWPAGARFRTGKLLIGAQVALSLLLLVAAGLCIRSLINLRAVPLGYDPAGLVFVTLNATPQQPTLVQETIQQLQGMPGVQLATASQYPLFGAAERSLPLCVPGFMSGDPDDRFVDGDQVAPGYFATWGVSLLEGRDFTWEDARRRHVIVNTAFARKYYGGRGLGQTLGYGAKCTGVEHTIIGVVADSTNVPRDTGRPMVYVPYRQNVGFATFAVRVADPNRFVPVLRAMLIERNSSIRGSVSTGAAYRDRELSNERLVTGFLIVFGAIGTLLSCVGLYGGLAYLVSRRTSEIGVRMALGAQRAAVVRLIMLESVAPVTLGLAAGAMTAFLATRVLDRFLFGVSRGDPVVTSAAVALFAAIAMLASVVPAVRASRIDPARTLRHE